LCTYYLSRKPPRSSAKADVGARFGPIGGLSQPRRDTADPKKIDYLLFSSLQIGYLLLFNNQYSIINNQSQSYPVRQSDISIAEI